MFGQPRCREWTPLATQQLRLRSLIQIVGYNIRPPERVRVPCRFYYTLHSTPMAAPFYMSEQLASTNPKWREIDSEVTQSMSSANVVIRIWCHMTCETPSQECLLAKKKLSPQKLQDVVVETWGVYFSGLLHIGANLATDFTANSFRKNTLVFQMLGGYFCSYQSLKFETVIPHEENALRSSTSVSDTSGKNMERSQHIPIEARFMQNQNHRFKDSQISSPSGTWRSDSVLSKSHSPPSDTSFRQSFAKNKNSGSLNMGLNRSRYSERSNCDLDSNYIYEHSPSPCSDQGFNELCPSAIVSDCDNLNDLCNDEQRTGNDRLLTGQAENYDMSKRLKLENSKEEDKPKYRYSCLTFLKSEIRPSYKADKLRKLHLLQFLIKKKKDSVQEIKERIYQKSAMELTYNSSSKRTETTTEKNPRSCVKRNLFALDDFESDDNSKSSSKNGKVGRKDGEHSGFSANDRRFTLSLNELLEIKSRPSPQQRWEHARLVRQLEIVRLKRALLVEQRDAKIAHVRLLKQRHAKLFEENQDNGTELMQGYHTLSRGTCPEVRKAKKQPAAALKALTHRSQRQLQARKATMLNQLAQIFYVEQMSETCYSICGAPGLRVCGTSTPVECGKGTPAKEAAAAGLAAQALIIAARILHQPLRHRIKLLGSASYIEDHLTHGLIDRDIPLFERGSPSLFQYGLFLLNGCIAQLLYSGGIQGGDARATLENLKRLMTLTLEKIPLDEGLDASRTLFGSDWSVATSPLPLPPPVSIVLPLSHPHSLRSMVADHRGNCGASGRQFNRFKECVDGSCSLAGTRFEKKHRHSRSVGSYNDEKDLQSLEISTASMLGSEPFLSIRNDVTITTDALVTASNIEVAQKVIFTIGDDGSSSPNWVKISSNNGDVSELESQCSNTECNDNFRKICTEISQFCEAECSKNDECYSNLDFCSVSVGDTNFPKNNFDDKNFPKNNYGDTNFPENDFDDTNFPKNNLDDTNFPNNDFDGPNSSRNDFLVIEAQLIDRKICGSVDIEEISCENCEKMNLDGSCDEILYVNSVLQDVIVIPSAEAKIDTGDNYRKRLNSNISISRIENCGVGNSKLENSCANIVNSAMTSSSVGNSRMEKCIDDSTIEDTEIGNSGIDNSGFVNSSEGIYSAFGDLGIENSMGGESEIDNSGFSNSCEMKNSAFGNTCIETSIIDEPK